MRAWQLLLQSYRCRVGQESSLIHSQLPAELCRHNLLHRGMQADLLSWSSHYNERDRPLTRSQINTILKKLIMEINRAKEGCFNYKLKDDSE